MGEIFNIYNFNLYTGRYSRRRSKSSPESETGWYIYDAIHEKLPVVALRNRDDFYNDDDNVWFLCWIFGRNFDIALDLILCSLKAWQAFRPYTLGKFKSDIKDMAKKSAKQFQNGVDEFKTKNLRYMIQENQDELILLMAKCVGRISHVKKKSSNPMMGSKIMHHLYPEFFPVWDTAWIKNKALRHEDDYGILSDNIKLKLQAKKYGKAAVEYAKYISLMFDDLLNTPQREYNNLKDAYIRYSEIPSEVIGWHFADLAPILFEVCLLGKHA